MAPILNKLPIVAVISQQRSGTNVLRRMMASGGEILDLQEVFHGNDNSAANFWLCLARQIKSDPKLACPHHWYQAWETYLQEQYQTIGHRPFIVDIKIDHFRYILTTHHSAHFVQDWFFFFDVSNFKFIYLERENLAALVVSRMRAEMTGIWGVPVEYEVPDHSPFVVDPSALEKQMDSMSLANLFGLENIIKWRPLKLVYENLFNDQGAFDEKTIRSIGRFTGLNAGKFQRVPLLRKQARASFLEKVENKTEVVQHFLGTRYESMFKEDSDG